jgi:hypothetical protein
MAKKATQDESITEKNKAASSYSAKDISVLEGLALSHL